MDCTWTLKFIYIQILVGLDSYLNFASTNTKFKQKKFVLAHVNTSSVTKWNYLSGLCHGGDIGILLV